MRKLSMKSGIGLGLAACAGMALAEGGYLADGQGQPVRDAGGACVRSGSWSATQPWAPCDPPPPARPDRVVLLPAPDGSVGAVTVRGAKGEMLLDSAYAGAEIDRTGAIAARREDAASVAQRYGAVLDARPPRPLGFVVHFVSGSSTALTAESQPAIEAMKRALLARPAPEIAVIGHTDRVGKLEANDALSRKRAETVRDILVAAGVQAAGIEIAGRGEREPLVPTADEVAEARNRRVEINVR